MITDYHFRYRYQQNIVFIHKQMNKLRTVLHRVFSSKMEIIFTFNSCSIFFEIYSCKVMKGKYFSRNVIWKVITDMFWYQKWFVQKQGRFQMKWFDESKYFHCCQKHFKWWLDKFLIIFHKKIIKILHNFFHGKWHLLFCTRDHLIFWNLSV